MERTETTEKKLTTPSTEVLEKPARRWFTAQYKLRILAETDGCTEMAQVGELLRREGLYSSLLSTWRKQRDEGVLAGLTPNRRGRKAKAKVHPKLAQTLARHSTINLTMNVYTDVGLDEKAEAVASLPAPKSPTSEGDNEPVEEDENSGPAARVVPCGAQNGAQRLSRNGRPMARNGNGELSDRADKARREEDRKSLPEKRFGKKRKEMAAIDTAISEGEIEARPAGFEPATLGSEGCRPDDVSPSDTKDLRQGPNDAVPLLVPSSSQADFAAISPPPADPDLAQILAAWPRLPEAIKAGILAMVQAAGGPDV